MKKKHSFSFKMMARTFVVSLLIITLVISSVPTTGIFGNQVRGAYARETSGKALSASTGEICQGYTEPLDLSLLTESTNSVTKDGHSHAEGEECWSWDNTTKTLTINNLDIDAPTGTGTALAIPGSTGDTVTINIQGNSNNINSNGKILTTEANLVVKGAGTFMGSSMSQTDVAVYVEGDLTVGGSTLFYIATNAYQAINVGKNLTTKENGKIDTRGDISVGGSLEVNGGDISVQGGKTNDEGADDAIINVVGSITVVSGRISADIGHRRSDSTILETGSTFTMNGGTVALIGGPIGLYVADEIKILGGTFNATGTNITLYSGKLITVGEKATIMASETVDGTLEAAKVFSVYTTEGKIAASSVVLSSTDDAETDPTLAKKVSIIFPAITFDQRNGNAVEKKEIADGTITMPAEPTLVGYEFAGWYNAANWLYTTAFVNANLTKSATVYAKWTLNGQIANTQKYTTGLDLSAVTADADCSRDGHIHAVEKCWNLNWINNKKTLTINDLNIDAPTAGVGLKIHSNNADSATLILKGDNKISAIAGYAIYANCNLTIEGDGSLTMNGADNTTKLAMFVNSLIMEGGTVNVTGVGSTGNVFRSDTRLIINDGSLNVIGSGTSDKAIILGSSLEIKGGTLNVSGAKVGISSPANQLLYKGGKIIASGSDYALEFSKSVVDSEATIMASDTVDGTLEEAKLNLGHDVVLVRDETLAVRKVEMFVAPAITFDQRNGSAAIKAVINEETKKTTMPANPTLVGYEFAGWYNAANWLYTTEFVNENLTESATVYAKWTLNGQIANTQKYTTGLDLSAVTADADCSRNGHIHAVEKCWSWNNTTKTMTINELDIDAPTGTGLKIPGATTDIVFLVLKGNNKINTDNGRILFVDCNLTIMGTGSLTASGSSTNDAELVKVSKKLTMESGTVTVTEKTTNKQVISSEDITINGGMLEAKGLNASTVVNNFGTLEINGGTLKVMGGTNTTYAIYQQGNITIKGGTIDVRGAQNGISSPYAYLDYDNGKIIASGSNIAIGIKSFDEINPDATIMASDTVDGTLVLSEIVLVGGFNRIAVGGNVEVAAKSVEMFVTPAITFDQRSGSDAIKAVINEETKKITMPADPTYDGYVFAGWYTGIDGTGTTFVNEDLVSAKVYAKWTLNGQIANTQKYTEGLDVSNITTDASCVTKDNHAHIAGNECWNLNWINNKKTLTINDLNIDAPTAGIGLRIHGVNADSATLILKGDNKISAIAGYAIYANCNLTIEGDGSLTMNGSDETNKVAAFVYSLIMEGGTVNVTEKGSTGNVFWIFAHLIINDGSLNVIGSGENDKAIKLDGYLEMNGGTLNVSGAKAGISSPNNQLTYEGGKIIASGSDFALQFFKSTVNPDATIMASDTVDGTLEEAKVNSGNKIVLVRDETLTVKSVEMFVIPTITIKALNGNLDVKEVIAENGKITMPAKPTLDGYVFAGWYNATNGLYTTEFKNENLTKSATVYAKWTLNGQIANTQKYTTGLDFSALTPDVDCSRDGHVHAVEKCWSWNNATKTLTINGLNIDAPTGHAIKVGSGGSTENLVINGNNKINTGNGYVVYALGNLIISGTGSLTATGENTSVKYLMYISGFLKMNSGTVSLTGNGALLTVIGCSQIDIYGGTLEATGLNTKDVINVSSLGNVNIFGGTIKATGGAGSKTALLASKTIEVKGGTLDVSGAEIGIQCKKLTIANNGKRLIASGSLKAIDITDLTATGLISFGGLSIKASATDGVTFEPGMVSTDGKNVVLVGDTAAIAKYVKASIASIITFDARGGHQDATATVDVDTNMITTMPGNPTYGAYVFGGWYTGIDGTGTKFENKNLTDSATVYAKWTSADGQIANTQKYDNGLDLSAVTANADCSQDGHVHPGKKCWVWDDAKKTLELNNATTNNNAGGAGLILPGSADDDVTLILNGRNNVFGKNAPALKTNANLTITGDGELSAMGDTAIDVAGDLTVKDKSRVFAYGKYPAIKVGKDMLVEKNGYINTTAGIVIDGALTVNGGDLVVSGNIDTLEAKDSVIKVVGSIIINGGKVNVGFNKSAKGYGIYTESTFTITGGNVNIEGREAAYNTGILSDKEFVMSGGTITVAGAKGDSFASIYSNSKITITGGTLDLSGSEVGLCGFDEINISGGKTSAKGTGYAITSNKPIIVDAKGAIKGSNTVDGTLESAKVFNKINSNNEIIASYIVLSSTDDTAEEPDSAQYVQIVFKSSSKDDSFEIIDTSPNTSVVVPPLAGGESAPTTVEAKVDATVDGDGNVSVDVTDKIMRDAIDSAIKEANKNGNTKNGIFVIIRVSTNGGNESKISVNLPKTVQERVINGNVLNTVVIVDRPDITINMDINTIKEINKQANADVKLSAERIANSSLSGEAKEAISTRPVFDLEATFGVGSKVSDFGLGQVAVGIPYVLQAGEKAENVRAVYVNAIGKVEWLKDSYYDVETSTVMFNSNHFSIYGVGYQEITTGPIDPTNPVDPTTPTTPTANYTWLWILIAVIVIGGGVTFYIIKKKKNETK